MSDSRRQGDQGDHAEALRKIADLLDSLRFGSIEIVVHEGRIVQIERREKVRVR
jgi:hypothetical protein